MALIRTKYRSNSFAVTVGVHVNNGTTSSVILPFCNTMLSSQGIERLSSTTLKVSDSGLYEITFPLSVKASAGLTFFVDIGVNGSYSQITATTFALTTTFWGDTYKHIMPLNAGDNVTIRVRLSAVSANFITNCSVVRSNIPTDNTVLPTSTLKKI
jgi:hypothetical protein